MEQILLIEASCVGVQLAVSFSTNVNCTTDEIKHHLSLIFKESLHKKKCHWNLFCKCDANLHDFFSIDSGMSFLYIKHNCGRSWPSRAKFHFSQLKFPCLMLDTFRIVQHKMLLTRCRNNIIGWDIIQI